MKESHLFGLIYSYILILIYSYIPVVLIGNKVHASALFKDALSQSRRLKVSLL